MVKHTIIALDINTLHECNGPIRKETVQMLKQYCHIGICGYKCGGNNNNSGGDSDSNSNDTNMSIVRRLAEKHGLGFWGIGKAECLKNFYDLWGGGCVGFLYMSKLDLDMYAALRVGWNFVNVNNIKLNLGCGEDIRFGYVNIDIRKIWGVNIVLDLENDKLPFQDNLVSEIIAQDVIEHIHYNKIEFMLRECYRVLKHGGKMYIRTPDLERIYYKAVVRGESLGEMKGYKLLSYLIFGGYKNEYDVHRCVFTKELLVQLLENIGFTIGYIKNDNSNIVCECYKL